MARPPEGVAVTGQRWPAGGLALLVAGCAGPGAIGDAPREVLEQAIAPYAMHEECLRVVPGERLEYRYDSTEPVSFNIHYHVGNAIISPISRDQSVDDAGVFAPILAQTYCLMWEAGAAGAVLSYRLRMRRNER
jgi:hypothetical protein